MSEYESFENAEQNLPPDASYPESSFAEKFKQTKAKFPGKPRSIIWKILMIGLLTLLLLIPLSMISGVISERQMTRDQVVNEISGTWAGEQRILGPVLALPYKQLTTYEDEKGQKKQITVNSTLYLLPKQYDVTGKLDPQVKKRAIYESVVYDSQINMNGSFDTSLIQDKGIAKDSIQWNKAFIVMGVTSTNGISNRPGLIWNGQLKEFFPGVNGATFIDAGLFAPVAVTANQPNIPFNLNLSLRGSQSISFVPIGKQSNFVVSSSWKNPSFIGSTLPEKPTVNDLGFLAKYKISNFSRSYDQIFTEDDTTASSTDSETQTPVNTFKSRLNNSAIKVELLTPIDSYRQSDRAVKYGILFLVLTFATYFLFEVITKNRLHPFQYLLVGLAISLFYLLLIAFSEVIAFSFAYLIASLAIISVISLYSKAILGKLKKGTPFIIAGQLIVLYTYLYVLLQLEELSLLFGSIGLLIVLTVIMYITRNIDWYNEQTA